MMLVNIDMLTNLTGSTRRTILRKCTDIERITGKGREHLFESKDALPAIIVGRKADDKTLESERTRLASAQAEKTELEVAVIKGDLIPAGNVESVVNGMISSFRSKMLSLPTKAAPSVVQMADVAEAETLLREFVYEALTELSEYDADQYNKSDDKQSGKASSTATGTDGKSVGRRKKKAVKGSQRGTRPVAH